MFSFPLETRNRPRRRVGFPPKIRHRPRTGWRSWRRGERSKEWSRHGCTTHFILLGAGMFTGTGFWPMAMAMDSWCGLHPSQIGGHTDLHHLNDAQGTLGLEAQRAGPTGSKVTTQVHFPSMGDGSSQCHPGSRSAFAQSEQHCPLGKSCGVDVGREPIGVGHKGAECGYEPIGQGEHSLWCRNGCVRLRVPPCSGFRPKSMEWEGARPIK